MCPTGDVEEFDEDDEVSEKKFAWTLIMERNCKKKSGSFQSMGMTNYTHSHTEDSFREYTCINYVCCDINFRANAIYFSNF